ncbi:HigA family addiction module antitoxin [Methyloceanibacter sp.]|uniref:HigA family addiction module antitoxin n=1 Tax=Methyloceanibacter sp. TaxID=1965321 RepID=UPI002D3AD17F|nr:HigA family addiction module antitoxin [Methyloceanibacter sp.]HZP08570.1 HigA family addiction module antitoxin [Methyloceanibacter sp.]
MSKPRTYPKRDSNRCPVHPGAILREIVVPELGMSKTELAKALKMSRQQFHAILRERQPVTPETAVKLQAAFGGTAQSWLNMQSAYDLWHAERRIDVSDIPPMRAA